MGGESAFSHDPLHPPTLLFRKKNLSHTKKGSDFAAFLSHNIFFLAFSFFFARHLFCVRPSLVQQHSHTYARYFPFFSLVTFFLLLHLRTQTFPLQRHPSFSLEGLRGRKNVSASQMIFFPAFFVVVLFFLYFSSLLPKAVGR